MEDLKAILSGSGSAVIALSGGTDSTFLVSTAASQPGLRLLAVTVSTPYMFQAEVKKAASFCNDIGVKHKELKTDIPGSVISNPPDRCYLCKKEIMKLITSEARKGGYAVVFDGTNADDLKEYRPGLRALRESGVRSPLAEAGLTKEEIRHLAREAGLDVSNRPSNTCLLTRFPHDKLITPEDLFRAEEAERLVTEAGFAGARVRIHGELARIEIRSEQFELIALSEVRMKLARVLRGMGFQYVTIDAEGYRSGSMNKTEEA
ncbi:MAG: ATP-dependent sacrificial sulfur transferase LarE [Bacteroidales bacterium]|nr:ATP-dependent sacrificial sulfur transferase LarE [Bacteroidales bacterium]